MILGFHANAGESYQVVIRKLSPPTETCIIPEAVRGSADAYVISRLGQDCFSDKVTFLENLSGKSTYGSAEKFKVSYLLKFRKEAWSQVPVVVLVDEDLQCSTLSSYLLPDCEKDPSRCAINFNAEDAFNLAWEAGLDPQQSDFTLEFRSWSGVVGYVWYVVYTDRSKNGFSGVVINSNNGEILDTLSSIMSICR